MAQGLMGYVLPLRDPTSEQLWLIGQALECAVLGLEAQDRLIQELMRGITPSVGPCGPGHLAGEPKCGYALLDGPVSNSPASD